MRKFIICLCIVLSMFSLISCREKTVTENNIEIKISDSSNFSQEEIDNAVICVENYFKFPSATLTNIEYNEEVSNEIIEEYLKNNDNPLIDKSNFIVLLSDFHVDDSGDNDIFEPDTNYTDYRWLLKRRNEHGKWRVIDLGY